MPFVLVDFCLTRNLLHALFPRGLSSEAARQHDSRPSHAFICPPLLLSLAPDSFTAHSLFSPDLPRPVSLRSQPKATGEVACFQTGARRAAVPLPRPFSLLQQLFAEQLRQSPRRCWGGSPVEDGAGSAGGLLLTCFVLPFLLNRPQREGRDFCKIKYPRYISLVQRVL